MRRPSANCSARRRASTRRFVDPCSADQNPTGQVLINCTAQGVPPGYHAEQHANLGHHRRQRKSEAGNVEGLELRRGLQPAFIPRFSVEANYYNIKVKGAIQAVNANTTLQQCVVSNDANACALVNRTGSGQIANIQGLLNNIAAIETEGLDVNFSYRTAKMDWGTFGLTFNNTFLFNYDVFVPAADGDHEDQPRRHRAGQPRPGLPQA